MPRRDTLLLNAPLWSFRLLRDLWEATGKTGRACVLHGNRGLLHFMVSFCLVLLKRIPPRFGCQQQDGNQNPFRNVFRKGFFVFYFSSLIYFRNAVFVAFTISLITRICCAVQPFNISSISALEESSPFCPDDSKSSARTFRLSAIATKTGRLNLVFPVSMWLMCVTETPTRSANCS